MAKRLIQKQVESTLYMPSLYDTDTGDEDEGADQRDERSPSERNQNAPPSPSFALQRCLAWSQDDDQTEERVPGGEDDEQEAENENELHLRLFPQYSESSLSMVKSFGSFHSAVVDAVSSTDFHVNSISNNGIRPIHWEEQVTVDKNLDSFLALKKGVTTVPQ
jgi:hypothetical protein